MAGESLKNFYRRNLPHWQPNGAYLFMTWRLYGTLPRGTGTPACAPSHSRHGLTETPGRRFKRLDTQLDQMKSGPRWLANSQIAACVEATIVEGDAVLKQYELHAYVLMPNHVHLLILPKVGMDRIMRGIKGVSAWKANQILARKGKAFWQDESFDHWIRNEREYGKIRFYIEHNPVAAGLAKKAEEWSWGSAWFHVDGVSAGLRAQALLPVPQERG